MYVYFLSLFTLCNGYNILLSIPNSEKSETILVFEIASGLLESGHNVTLITGHKFSKEHKNLNQIWIPEVQKAGKILDHYTPEDFDNDIFKIIVDYYTVKNRIIWEDERTMDIWKSRKSYDLFFTLSYYAEGSFPYLMDNDIPFVQLMTPGSEIVALERDGHLLSPAISPSLLGKYDEIMTFWERTVNLKQLIEFYYGQKGSAREYMKPVVKVFPELGDYERFYDHVSLTFINSHYALDSPIPLLPNHIEIGGIHCKKPKPLAQLDKNLAEFVEGSGQAGIIYFSLGSIAKSSQLPQEAKEILLEAFRRIPQRVLWKYEEENLDHPPNVFIKKWMPQQDILGHPKTKVFISHCGALSSQEAKYHGVPILGIPMGFDQPRNCAKMKGKGHAISLSWKDITVEQIVDSLNILVNDASYKARMEHVSKIVRDQKETPKERAVWWLEYIIRHKGAPHLEYPGKRLSLFQYVLLDVVLVWLGIAVLIFFSLVLLVKFIFFGKRNKNVTDSLNRNKHQDKKKYQ